jgi:uncharacterized protein YjbI with pentapeptide repeats
MSNTEPPPDKEAEGTGRRTTLRVAWIGFAATILAAVVGLATHFIHAGDTPAMPAVSTGANSNVNQAINNNAPVNQGNGTQFNTMISKPDPMTIITMAMSVKPGGDFGQIAAIEQLVQENKALTDMDLRGIYWSHARLDGADFSKSTFAVSSLEGSSLKKANIGDASFYFARMSGVNADGADMTDSRLYFADASNGSFAGIAGVRSNWQAASVRHASFRNANLEGADFMMADVRDADFTGANLRGAFFIGAVIVGARFDNAKIENTDFSGAVGSIDEFTARQKVGICGTSNGGHSSYNYVIRRFDAKISQYENQYRDLVLDWATLPDGLQYLPPCKVRDDIPSDQPPIWTAGRGEAIYESFGMNMPAVVVDAMGRELQIVSRAQESLRVLRTQSGVRGGVVTMLK